ncbi:MAG: Ig-like domain-containing protein [Duncaniella sp.]|nr:Ig-like domain-containing protein [Duncaniella sp.]
MKKLFTLAFAFIATLAGTVTAQETAEPTSPADDPNTLFYANFDTEPAAYYETYTSKFTSGSNTDIIKKGATATVDCGGMIFHGQGSNGRIVAMSASNILTSSTAADDGASARCIQMISGSKTLYVQFPAVEGPANVTLYIGNAGGKTGTFYLTDENGDLDNPLAEFKFTDAAKTMHKFTYEYPYKGSVNFRLYNNGVQINVNDVIITKGEGEGEDKPEYKDETAPELTYSWPSASPYAPVAGNIVLIYNEPVVASAKAVLNDVEYDIEVNGNTAKIAYSGLENGHTYVAQIPALTDEAGNATSPMTMNINTVDSDVLYYTDYNYFPYSYWDKFHVYPNDGADNGDLLAKSSTNKTAEFGDITYSVGSTAGRVVAMGKSNLINDTDEESMDATQRCAQFSGGGNDLYAQLPEVQGPAKITLWVGNTTTSTSTIKLTNGDNAEELAAFEAPEKKMYKFTYTFTPSEKVAFRLYNNGTQFNLHDILLTKVDDSSTGIESVEAAPTEAPAVYYNLQGQRVDNPSAGLYIKVSGNDVRKVVVK